MNSIKGTDLTSGCWQVIAKEADLTRSLPDIVTQVQHTVPVRSAAVFTVNDNSERTELLASSSKSKNTFSGNAVSGGLLTFIHGQSSITVHSHIDASYPVIYMNLTASGTHRGAVLVECSKGDLAKASENLLAYQEVFSVAMANHLKVAELTRLHRRAEFQREDLLHRMGRDEMHDEIVGARQGLGAIMQQVSLVAPSDSTALILGETGSGKEVIARAIHQQSSRANMPFIRINCGAMPPELMDSELFGHEKGSFTGAGGRRRGWFERANGGTLFLDEVGELPMAAQVRLLRVIQEGALTRVGGEEELHVDVRIIAATHRNLAELVKNGVFREDLWYRLNVFPLYLPSLRERTSDIPALAHHFARRAARKLGLPFIAPTPEQLTQLAHYEWPGNVREMQVVIERAAILGRGEVLDLRKALGESFPPSPPLAITNSTAASPTHVDTLDNIIVGGIKAALNATSGRVEGYYGAARLLDINPNTLRSKMRKYGISMKKVVS